MIALDRECSQENREGFLFPSTTYTILHPYAISHHSIYPLSSARPCMAYVTRLICSSPHSFCMISCEGGGDVGSSRVRDYRAHIVNARQCVCVHILVHAFKSQTARRGGARTQAQKATRNPFISSMKYYARAYAWRVCV